MLISFMIVGGNPQPKKEDNTHRQKAIGKMPLARVDVGGRRVCGVAML